jgi:integrase
VTYPSSPGSGCDTWLCQQSVNHQRVADDPDRASRHSHSHCEIGSVSLNPQSPRTLAWGREHDTRPFAFYRLAAYTGARRGELLYLRWHAVDLEAAEITFGGSTAVVRGQRVEGTTKGGRSRTVSIDSGTVATLREHRRQQAEERLSAGSAWNDSGDLVFTSRWGEPLYPDTVTSLIAKLISAHNRSPSPPACRVPKVGLAL